MTAETPDQGPMSDAELARVHLDNVRTNQIGGQTDGITEEVAEDIGFKPPGSSNVTAEHVSEEAANLSEQFAGPEADAKQQAIEAKLDAGEPITQKEALFLKGKSDFERGGKPPIDVR